MADGKGIKVYGNGDIYDGEWRQDKRDGFGRLTRQNGDKITG